MGLVDPRMPKWNPIGRDVQHPLVRVDGYPLGPFATRILLGPRTRYGAYYFQLHLTGPSVDGGGRRVVFGLHNTGQYPAYNWIEVAHYDHDGLDDLAAMAGIQHDRIEAELWKALAAVIPPGGHLMVEYESECWASSRQALALGIPPVLTPLGFLMLVAGCGCSYKDWYISEGGLEGPRKLQGYKALDGAHAARSARLMKKEITEFLKQPRRDGCTDLESLAISIAPKAMAVLGKCMRRAA